MSPDLDTPSEFWTAAPDELRARSAPRRPTPWGMLVLLETLTADERAVFVLHEVFGFDHDDIATAGGKSVAAVRQMAYRGRSHVHARRNRFGPVDTARAAELTDRFMVAANAPAIAIYRGERWTDRGRPGLSRPDVLRDGRPLRARGFHGQAPRPPYRPHPGSYHDCRGAVVLRRGAWRANGHGLVIGLP